MKKRDSFNDEEGKGLKSHEGHNAKDSKNVNFTKLLLISVSFLGMYIALYSAQNVQSVLFQEDGYDTLGFLSNAFAYAGQGTGSVFCVWVLMKIGA